MEDIRKLLNDEEAEIPAESLAYTLRGPVWAMADELRDGTPSDLSERRRHLKIVGAPSRSLELYSAAMIRWMEKHVEECELKP